MVLRRFGPGTSAFARASQNSVSKAVARGVFECLDIHVGTLVDDSARNNSFDHPATHSTGVRLIAFGKILKAERVGADESHVTTEDLRTAR